MWKKIPDSFLLGLISGIMTLGLFYLTIAFVRSLVVEHYNNPYLFGAPKPQLFSIFLNVLVFRIVIVNLDKEKFGKGILFITVLSTLVYFFYYFRYNHSLLGV